MLWTLALPLGAAKEFARAPMTRGDEASCLFWCAPSLLVTKSLESCNSLTLPPCRCPKPRLPMKTGHSLPFAPILPHPCFLLPPWTEEFCFACPKRGVTPSCFVEPCRQSLAVMLTCPGVLGPATRGVPYCALCQRKKEIADPSPVIVPELHTRAEWLLLGEPLPGCRTTDSRRDVACG